MSSSIPVARSRRTFPGIAAVTWEHPADRAALQALRSVPGAEEVIKKILAMIGGERGIRLLFQGNAVRVGPEQYPRHLDPPHRGLHHVRLGRRARALRLPDAVRERRCLRHRRAVHRAQLVGHRAPHRRRGPRPHLARDGTRHERPFSLSHHRRDPRTHQSRCTSGARRARPAAGPARVPRVVPEGGALQRSRRPALAARTFSRPSGSS